MTPERIAELWDAHTHDWTPGGPLGLNAFALAIARAARRDALLEAARVCEQLQYGIGCSHARACAAAIRALIEEPKL